MTGTMNELENITVNTSLAAGDQVSHTDITGRIPEEWAQQVEAEAEKLRVFRNFAKVNTDLLNRPGATIKIPKKATIDYDTYAPTTLSELTAISPSNLPVYETVEITPVEVGMGAKISRQAIQEVFVDLIRDIITEMAENMAQKEDLDAISAITATTASQEVTYIEANYASDVYVSGKWTVAKAGAFTSGVWQASQTNLTVSAEGADQIDLGVITEAQDVIMAENGFKADTLVIHPRHAATLKRDPQFLDASKKGDGSVLKTGMIGNFFGMNVYVSQNLPKLKCGADGNTVGYQAIMLDSTRAFGLAVKRLAELETKYEPLERMHYLVITSWYKFQRINDGAIVLINTV